METNSSFPKSTYSGLDGLSRRGFLKTLGAVATVTAAGTALAACSSGGSTASSKSEASNTKSTGSLSAVDASVRHLPPDLASLPTVEASVKYTISEGGKGPSLEGPVFDRNGNFYCCHTSKNTIKKITPDGTISDFFNGGSTGMIVGLAFHKDGRMFCTDMTLGLLRIISADGQLLDQTQLTYEGRKLASDKLVFDQNGDLYISDLSGTEYSPIGGIYKLKASEGYKNISKFWGNLCSPNGLCFSPSHDALWVSESDTNTLNRFQLDANMEVVSKQYTPLRVFKNTGKPNVDTFCTDQKGYMYLGIMFGGRAVVLDNEGIPVANIVVPGWKDGKLQYTPNLTLHPNDSECYMVASDAEQAVILSFQSIAPSQQLYSLL